MNTVIKLLIIVNLLSSCQYVVGGCDAEELVPYTKDELFEEPNCSKKCCDFVVNETVGDPMTKMCHEMWCFRDCEWTMNHKACY